MGQVFSRTAGLGILMLGASEFFGCSTPPEQPVVTPPPVAVALPPEPPKSVMFDSDTKREWNIFPDPTSGETGVYHKGDYGGAVDGSAAGDRPVPQSG